MLPSTPARSTLISFGASLAHFISLGILNPSHSFLLLSFLWVFAKSFELSQPNYHILYFCVYWPLNQSHLLIPSLGSFGLSLLAFHFLWFPWAYYFLIWGSLESICLLWGPFTILWVYVPLFLLFRFNSFSLLILLSSTLLYCWVSSCHWALLPKWASTKAS